jgi:hypothetical protein
MRLVSVHPGVEPDDVLARTGFPLHADDVGTTRTPTDEEAGLPDALDPEGVREREVPAEVPSKVPL